MRVAIFSLEGVLIQNRTRFYEINKELILEKTGKIISQVEHDLVIQQINGDWINYYAYFGIGDGKCALESFYEREKKHPVQMFAKVHETLQEFTKIVPCYVLTKSPDRESALTKTNSTDIAKYIPDANVITHTEKIKGFQYACIKERCKPETCYFFTDMRKEIIEGKRVGVKAVGVAQQSTDKTRESMETYESLKRTKPQMLFSKIHYASKVNMFR